MKKNADYLLKKKQSHQKIVALTCYDYPTALLEDQAGTVVGCKRHVGDSAGEGDHTPTSAIGCAIAWSWIEILEESEPHKNRGNFIALPYLFGNQVDRLL